ncbi:hypothetical protein CHS0354_000952 [Potamilus streckersoni]|uniref:Uncharacterized protein n=1 Tax=Potamilus streckersoni TaxID=2493646 RepID=A0AAE0W148_9BIVA|nr:hypothetical protein CHS0354_000952 [Potamilus streckersoni]
MDVQHIIVEIASYKALEHSGKWMVNGANKTGVTNRKYQKDIRTRKLSTNVCNGTAFHITAHEHVQVNISIETSN